MEEIYEAIKKKDLKSLSTLITTKNINTSDKKKHSALTLACQKGYLDVVKFLVEDKKANVDRKDGKANTPLYVACLEDHRPIIDYLLERKADINKHSANNFTPVYAAVEKDNLELLEYLASKNADLNAKCPRGGLVRHAVCKHSSTKCLAYMLEKKLDLNTYHEQFGQSIVFELCVQYLARRNDEAKAKSVMVYLKQLLKAGADTSLKSKIENREETPLHIAAKCVDNRLMTTLLEHGADINQQSANGATPLLSLFFLERKKDPSAAKSRKAMPIECVETLFKYKADPNIPNVAGVTPFLYFMSSFVYGLKEDTKLLKLFLENGADVNVCDFAGEKPIHFVASKGGSINDLIKMLIEYGADINTPNGNGENVIHLVARREESTNTSGYFGGTFPWDFMIENGAEIKANKDGELPHFVAYFTNRSQIFNSMLKHGVDINATNKRGETLIHMLARQRVEGGNHMQPYGSWNDPVSDTIEAMEADQKFDLYIKDDKGRDFYDLIMGPRQGYYNGKKVYDLLKKKGYDTPELDPYGCLKRGRSGENPLPMQQFVAARGLPVRGGGGSGEDVPSRRYASRGAPSGGVPSRGAQARSRGMDQYKVMDFSETSTTTESNPLKPIQQTSISPKQTTQASSRSKLSPATTTPKSQVPSEAAKAVAAKSSTTASSVKSKPKAKEEVKSDKNKKAAPPVEPAAPEPKLEAKQPEQPPDEEKDGPKDVMISYNWGHQDTAFKIRDYLRSKGNLSIWIDTEQMSDDIFGKMAQAVVHSKIIIMCLSEKYELSDNCKLEYEYVAKKKKNFVPVKVQKDYEPRDGFSLDMILGSKLYYMLSEKGEFEKNIPQVLKAVQDIMKRV